MRSVPDMSTFERRGMTIWEAGATAMSVANVNQHHKRAREYADLIVLALNTHEELVEALQAARVALNSVHETDGLLDHEEPALAKIDAALSKATA